MAVCYQIGYSPFERPWLDALERTRVLCHGEGVYDWNGHKNENPIARDKRVMQVSSTICLLLDPWELERSMHARRNPTHMFVDVPDGAVRKNHSLVKAILRHGSPA